MLPSPRLLLAALCFAAVIASSHAAFAQSPEVVLPPQGPIGEYTSNGLPIGVPETTGGIYGEPLQRYDAAYPWLHGYFQEIPAYGGFGAYRPYNYKHVFAQSQASGGWGMSPTMPYSQQFWHRYRKRALMSTETYSESAPPPEPTEPPGPAIPPQVSRRAPSDGPRIIPADFSRR